MKHLVIPAALVAALLSTGCETQQVCRTYGNQTTCRTERVPTEAERDRTLNHALYTVSWMNCYELGHGSKEYCKAKAKRESR